jgi:hypothetical protein
MDRKKKRLPARAWLIASSSSIMGRRGEMTVRVEKLRNQRPQKTKRRKIFMAGGYTFPGNFSTAIFHIFRLIFCLLHKHKG